MAFSYSPLDLYYSFSAIVRNDQLNEEKKKGLNDFMIIKRETEKMFKFLRNTFDYSWTGIIQFFFGFNDNSWYIYKYKETEEKSYYYVYGIHLRIVSSFQDQIKFIERSNEVYTYIKNYFTLYSDDIKIEANIENAIIKQENKEVFDILEKYISKLNQIREEKEREDGEKIQRRRYFTIDEIEKYKSIIEKKEYDYSDKSYFDYFDMKYY